MPEAQIHQTILFVNACVRPNSRTRQLAEYLTKYLNGAVETIDLQAEQQLQPLDWTALERRDRLLHSGDLNVSMFQPARRFAAADEIVIAAPYWDLSFPASLKVFLEHVTVTGVTFRYAEDGRPTGLCRARRLFYVTTAGGPILRDTHGFGYVQDLAVNLYGIPEVIRFQAENLDVVGQDVRRLLETAKADIDQYFASLR